MDPTSRTDDSEHSHRRSPHWLRAVAVACIHPELSATELHSWRALVLKHNGSTPATRAASDEDNRRWVDQQLLELPEMRAAARMAKARALELERRLRSLAQMIREEPGAAAMKARVECVLIDAGLLDDPEVACD